MDLLVVFRTSRTVPRRLGAGAVVMASIMSALALSPVACFSLKEPPCAFTCVEPPHRCPSNYTCGDDGLCHRVGVATMCPLAPPGNDGAVGDDAVNDAAGDAGTD
jgi:hypothetical protein